MEINGIVIEDAVSRGFDLLDTYGPENWRDMVDRETYHHHDAQNCILGQVYGSYFVGTGALEQAISNADAWDEIPNDGEEYYCCASCTGALRPRFFGFDGTGEMNDAFEAEWRKRLWGPTVPDVEEC